MPLPEITDRGLGVDVASVCATAARLAALSSVGVAVQPRSVRHLAGSIKAVGPLFAAMQAELRSVQQALEAERADRARFEAQMTARLRRAWRMQQLMALLGVTAGILLGLSA
jgi:hypothetical protein